MWFSASCSLFYFLCRKTNYSFHICTRASFLVFVSSMGFITLSKKNCAFFFLLLLFFFVLAGAHLFNAVLNSGK